MSLFPRTKEFPAKMVETDAYTIPLLQPDRWIEQVQEGELAVDVYEAGDLYVVQATLAGVRPDDLQLSIQRDLLTIRGQRRPCAPHANRRYLNEECFWGNFSRSILLPESVDVPRATATLTLGVLTIDLPKLAEQSTIAVREVE